MGEILDFDFELTADNGVLVTDMFSLVVGLDIEDFESGDFSTHNWNFGGSENWVIDPNSYEGLFSAKSGDINNDSSSDIFIILNVLQESEISFWKKVSSEANFDYFRFYIDGEMIGEWSGEEDWSEESYIVTAGNHVFQWKYEKDGAVTAGDDCVWLDYIIFPVTYQSSGAGGTTIPMATELIGNFPNPFNPSTTISFTLFNGHTGITELDIYNLKGQKVKTLVQSILQTGNHEIIWNGTDDDQKSVSSGIYFYKLKTKDYEKINKMILLK